MPANVLIAPPVLYRQQHIVKYIQSEHTTGNTEMSATGNTQEQTTANTRTSNVKHLVYEVVPCAKGATPAV